MHGLQPLVTRFSAPARQLGPRRRARLERIARSAVCQSLGVRLPELRAPRSLAELETAGFDRILLAHGSGTPLAAPPPAPPPAGRRLLLLVGPEGGWAPGELALLEERGALRTSLGGRRLRAETAALAGLALLLCRASGAGRD